MVSNPSLAGWGSTLSKRQILDSSKQKEFEYDNFEFYENGRKFSKWVENTVVKGEIAQRTCTADTQNQGLFGKGIDEFGPCAIPCNIIISLLRTSLKLLTLYYKNHRQKDWQT